MHPVSKVRIRNGPYSGREQTLNTDPLTIGRDSDAGIQILDRSASRFHAEIFPVGEMYFVRDLDSKNGTYINDQKLTDEELLRDGDVIKIGTTELILEPGIALKHSDESSDRLAFRDEEEMLSNTLEFRINDLTDLVDQADSQERQEDESRALQILYQVGRLSTESDPNQASEVVLDFLIKALPAESAIIFLRNFDSGKLAPSCIRTIRPNVQPVISRTIIRRTVAENRAFFTANAQDDSGLRRKDSVVHNNIRSVVCVPMMSHGKTKGVLYVSRGSQEDPFDRADMELLSACAVHLSLVLQTANQLRRQRQDLWAVLKNLVDGLERHHDLVAAGYRTANACAAVAQSLGLSHHETWRLQIAGLIHHLDRLLRDQGMTPADLLADIEALDHVAPLIRLSGNGPHANDSHSEAQQRSDNRDSDDADSDHLSSQILSACRQFIETIRAQPDADALDIITNLSNSDAGQQQSIMISDEVLACLRSCHLDGTLYQQTMIA